jgi:hypothetical protein
MYIFGIIMGVLLLAAKYGGFWLVTSVRAPATDKWNNILLENTGEVIYEFKQRKTGNALLRIPIIGWIIYPFTSDKTRETGIRDVIGENPLLLFLVDAVFGYLGLHVLAIMGGSIISGIALVAYTVICMLVIFMKITAKKVARMFAPKRQPAWKSSSSKQYSFSR